MCSLHRASSCQLRPALLLTVVLVIISLLYLYQAQSHLWVCDLIETYGSPFSRTDASNNVGFRRRLADQLHTVAERIRLATERNMTVPGSVEDEIRAVLAEVDPNYPAAAQPITHDPQKLEDGCPEVYKGVHTSGQPWEPGHCPNLRPVSELVTVAVNLAGLSPDESSTLQDTLLSDLHRLYPGLTAVVTSGHPTSGQVTVVLGGGAGEGAGAAWNRAVAGVQTRFTLLLRSVQLLTEDIRLERMLAAMAVIPRLSVVGGAFRNSTGHWRVGCWQTTLQYYHLRRQEGYRHSTSECMLCDYADGPLLVRTSLLRDVPFDESLPDSVVFDDWFLQVKQRDVVAAVCPDVMFHVLSGQTGPPGRLHWQALATKWQINMIQVSRTDLLRFTCEETETRCSPRKQVRYYMTPPCCYVQLLRANKFLSEFLQQHGARYRLIVGSCLAAVKMGFQLPWDFDMDIATDPSVIDLIQEHSAEFKQHGITLGRVQHISKTSTTLNLYTPDYTIELYAGPSHTDDLGPGHVLVLFNGVWQPVPENPAGYLREHYGKNVLRHEGHWRYVGSGTTMARCPHPQHHACLDQVPLDGSTPFYRTYAEYLELR